MIDSYHDRWALVTGASSGIGAAFARRLAGRGMNLVLTARRIELLEAISEELVKQHANKVEIIVEDLSDPFAPKRLWDRIQSLGIQIELLVNNAGFGIINTIAQTDRKRILEMIDVNIKALTELTYLALPGMMERQHGAIINLSSVAGFQPVAYMGAYAATKAYVLHFTEALWAEAREKKVTVMALCPGYTRTEFFDIAGRKGWLNNRRAQDPNEVVRIAIKALERSRSFVICGLWNYILTSIVKLATRRIVVRESTKYFRPVDDGKSG